MKVTIATGSWGQRYLNGVTEKEMEFAEAPTAFQAVLAAGVPEDEIGVLELGDKLIDQKQLLSDGQTILVYPSIIGG